MDAAWSLFSSQNRTPSAAMDWFRKISRTRYSVNCGRERKKRRRDKLVAVVGRGSAAGGAACEMPPHAWQDPLLPAAARARPPRHAWYVGYVARMVASKPRRAVWGPVNAYWPPNRAVTRGAL
jgi:hypothetical protein